MDSGSWPRRLSPLPIILLASFLLRLHNLGHTGLSYCDESFHAIVARNLLKHPLEPTLIDDPKIPYHVANWWENHVWLHKPILPLWQIAVSYALLGVNTFALRLPSLLLSTASVSLTYLIGQTLFDRRTALFAAALQAVNPAITLLVQGYLFSDHVDVSLLFWVEMGVYFLVRATKSGAWRDVCFAGVAQGLAFLSKSYLAALITGLALTAWLLSTLGLGKPEETRLRWRHVLGLVAASLATVAPWTIYCIVRFPYEFRHEHDYVLAHLYSGIEVWSAPWDRVIFDYLIARFNVFYTPILVAALALLGKVTAGRQASLWILFAWVMGVLAPHLMATSKTPTATLIAMPACFLLLGRLISEALQRGGWPLYVWVGITVASLIYPAGIRPRGSGYPDPPVFGGVMRQSLWVLGHVIAAQAVALAIFAWTHWLRHWCAKPPRLAFDSLRVLRFVGLAGTLVLLADCVRTSWVITDRNRRQPSFPEIAAFARTRLPKEAVLLFDGPDRGEHQAVMLFADRPCYALHGRPLELVARQVLAQGGAPYIVSAGPLGQPPLFTSQAECRAVYHWRDTALASGAAVRPH